MVSELCNQVSDDHRDLGSKGQDLAAKHELLY